MSELLAALTLRPQIMGVLNTTPDSFSDGGRHFDGALKLDSVARRIEEMLAEGVDIIDVGGESTRPGAAPVSPQQEMERVLPVVELIRSLAPVAVSVDTSTPEVMVQAAAAGASLINDVRALRREGALEAAAATKLPVCLMHMQGEPATMQQQPCYGDVVAEVRAFLLERVAACEGVGIARQQIILDPGFGFGKSLAHNVTLFQGLGALSRDFPLLVGVSRKSMIGNLLNRDVQQRLAGGLALAVLALQRGARIVRTHDVAETVDALRIWQAIELDHYDHEQ